MRLWEFLKSEIEQFKELVDHSATVERVWDCEPLLVIDDKGEVVFAGSTDVDVHPHRDGTADLLAHAKINGWQPSLVAAKLSVQASTGTVLGGGMSHRGGLICTGHDPEGNGFTWYINGSAERVAQRYLVPFELGSPETPVE